MAINKQTNTILFVSQSFYPAVGGVSTLLLNVADFIQKKGYRIHTIHFEIPGADKELKISGIPITQHVIPSELMSDSIKKGYADFKEIIYGHLHGLKDFPYSNIQEVPGYEDFISVSELFLKQVCRVISEENIDIVHLHDYQVIGCLSALPVGVKSVFSLHAPLLKNVNPVVSNWLVKYLNKANALVFSVDEYSQTAIEVGLPKEKISTLPPIIDPKIMDINSDTPIPPLSKISKNDIVITCVQRFDSKSGQYQLVSAFSEITNRHPNARLLLVGGPSFTDSISSVRQRYYSEVVDLIGKLGLKDKVILAGNVDYLDLPRVYRRSDIVVMLSKMECFGLAVSEAMYHGKPVVVTDVGGLAYQVKHGYNGFRVKPRNIPNTAKYLDLLVSDVKLQTKMGNNGKKFFNRYLDPRVIMPKYVQIYSRILRGKNPVGGYDYLYNQIR